MVIPRDFPTNEKDYNIQKTIMKSISLLSTLFWPVFSFILLTRHTEEYEHHFVVIYVKMAIVNKLVIVGRHNNHNYSIFSKSSVTL